MVKVGFLFSGQGAQSVGMMRDIAEASSSAKSVFETADRVLGRSITKLCFEGPQEELNFTYNTQPCLLAAELAAFAALIEEGIKPDMVAGFSLGEYAALVAAGVIGMDDAFRIIQTRADAMQKACPVGKGAMAAITKQDAQTVYKLCDEVEGYVIPVNFNCPGQIVVSGEASAVDQICALAKSRKIRAIRLPVSVPAHCSLMAPAADKLAEVFTTVDFHVPMLPCYSDVDARPYEANTDVGAQLCKQVQTPVLWEKIMRNMYADGVKIFVEIGPGSTLTSFVKKTLENVEQFSVNSWEELKKYTELRRQ